MQAVTGIEKATYSSASILERRSRILKEVRKVIAEEGVEALSMNDIGKRANVAKRTLYNAFQTRERMIAIAIQEYFQKFVDAIHFRSEPDTLVRNIERMLLVVNRNRQIRNYIRTIMALYFSPDPDPEIRQAMHGVATESNLKWLRIVQQKKQLQPRLTAERVADDVVRLEYATIHAWAQGVIADDDIVDRLLVNYLTYIIGATRGGARREAETLLTEVHDHGVTRLVQAGFDLASLDGDRA